MMTGIPASLIFEATLNPWLQPRKTALSFSSLMNLRASSMSFSFSTERMTGSVPSRTGARASNLRLRAGASSRESAAAAFLRSR